VEELPYHAGPPLARAARRRRYARIAAAITGGTLVQLARSSSATIRGISRCALRWVIAYAGLGMVVTGERITAFSMCSSIGVLCTHPAPLWMSCGVDVGYAPQGGAPKANSRPDHTFTVTAP